MKKSFSYICLSGLLSLAGLSQSYAQELQARVEVSITGGGEIANVDKSIWSALESQCTNFLNNTKWTSETYEQYEKIECNLLFNLKSGSASDGKYSGSLTVTSRRPVYGSSYYTPILNVLDEDFTIVYQLNQVFDYSSTTYLNNLSSILSFYAYMIIGLDYDSFSPLGGTPYFNKAMQIAQLAQVSSAEKGWRLESNKLRSRWVMIEEITSPAYEPFRTFMYDYHRNAFDQFFSDFDAKRPLAFQALARLEEIHKQKASSYLLYIALNAKRDEALNLMKDAPKPEIVDLIKIMNKIDGANANRWNAMNPQ